MRRIACVLPGGLLLAGLLMAVLSPGSAGAENITVATYNIEVFQKRFIPSSQPINNSEVEMDLRNLYDLKNWAAAQVILDGELDPDVIVIQECCAQEELEKFNARWLGGVYETVRVFPSNTNRDQHLAIMLKPGYKIVEEKSDYHKEPDPLANDRGFRLFARGPAFALVQSPSGYKFWVGVTHQKSKRMEDADQAKWRLRESARTHQIMKELQKQGPTDVMLLGDMNDEFGYNEFEMEAGGDAIRTLIGPKEDNFFLATKPLVDAGMASFGGYWRINHRTLIDHIIMSPSMKNQVLDVKVFQKGVACVASDHYPVYVRLKADAPGQN